MSRDDFEEVLGAMARAELIAFADAVFETQGKRIPYRNVSILPAGLNFNESQAHLFVMRDAAAPAACRQTREKAATVRGVTTPAQGRLAKPASESRASAGAAGSPGAGIARLAIDRGQTQKHAGLSHLWRPYLAQYRQHLPQD